MSASLDIVPKFVPKESQQPDYDVSENIVVVEHVWLCVYFPKLALQVFEYGEGVPFVVIEQQKNRHFIFAACDIAQSYGVTPGMPLNAAHALCRNLVVRVRDVQLEQKKLKRLARQAAEFTPSIALESPNAILMEVSGSLKLFGGMEKLQSCVRDVFSQEKQAFLIAAAPTPTAAWLLAYNGIEKLVTDKASLKSVLGGIALADTGLSMKLVDSLSKSGLCTLRDMWRLPRNGLARRFGRSLLVFLDRASGMQADLRRMFIPGVCFYSGLELPVHSDNLNLLSIAIQKLLDQVESFLLRHDGMVETLFVELWYDRESYTSIVIRLQKASRQADRFLTLIKERLEHTVLPDTVERIALRIDQVLPYATTHPDLFNKRDADEQDWQQLMEIIKARVGHEKVCGVRPAADHRPERAWEYCNPQQARHNAGAESWFRTLQRPLGLLLQPRPVSMYQTKLKFITSAERIASGWWDDGDVSRDYYIAVTKGGERWWIYQDKKNDNRWYLHGLFA